MRKVKPMPDVAQRKSEPTRKAGRPVVRCPSCGLVQFWPDGKTNCVRPGCRYEIGYRLTEKLMLEKMDAGALKRVAPLFDSKALARRIKEVRNARGLSQQKAAKIMGVPRTYFSKIENSRAVPTLRSLQRFAAALGVSEGQLLNDWREPAELVHGDAEALRQLDEWLMEMAEASAGIAPHDLRIVVGAAKSMAAGQYVLPEWMML